MEPAHDLEIAAPVLRTGECLDGHDELLVRRVELGLTLLWIETGTGHDGTSFACRGSLPRSRDEGAEGRTPGHSICHPLRTA